MRPIDGLCLPCPTHIEVFFYIGKKTLDPPFGEKKAKKTAFIGQGRLPHESGVRTNDSNVKEGVAPRSATGGATSHCVDGHI